MKTMLVVLLLNGSNIQLKSFDNEALCAVEAEKMNRQILVNRYYQEATKIETEVRTKAGCVPMYSR
jgi:hypothetical protein